MAISPELVKETVTFFAFTMAELTVLFIGISFLVGVINEFLPREKVKRLLSGRGGRGYIIGALLGGLSRFCSCSTIPVTVGLLRARAGFGPTMAFLFTSPLVNPIIIPLFFTLQQTLQCCATGDPSQISASVSGGGRGTLVLPTAESNGIGQPNRWKRILDDAVMQFRRLMPFIILGVAIGSFIHGFLPADMVVQLAGANNPHRMIDSSHIRRISLSS